MQDYGYNPNRPPSPYHTPTRSPPQAYQPSYRPSESDRPALSPPKYGLQTTLMNSDM